MAVQGQLKATNACVPGKKARGKLYCLLWPCPRSHAALLPPYSINQGRQSHHQSRFRGGENKLHLLYEVPRFWKFTWDGKIVPVIFAAVYPMNPQEEFVSDPIPGINVILPKKMLAELMKLWILFLFFPLASRKLRDKYVAFL